LGHITMPIRDIGLHPFSMEFSQSSQVLVGIDGLP
jgi:hypothetical protein